jgi:hypothetical protein
MSIHALGIGAAIACITGVTLLPFFPGRYDSLAAPLSLMAQVFGIVGLLLVPVGALWLAAGYSSRLGRRQYAIATAALIVSSIVWLAVALAALVSSGASLAIASLALWSFIVARLLPRLTRLKTAPPRAVNAAACYLLTVPLVVALLQKALVAPMIESSRNRAIRNSAQLIADIEQYRAVNGRYPASLLSVWEDYLPGVIGIREYWYEPSGEAYNVVFEQPALNFGTREFVVYNPRDEQGLTSHKLDRARLTPAQLVVEQTRGHYAVHDAAHPHWKYFWFD